MYRYGLLRLHGQVSSHRTDLPFWRASAHLFATARAMESLLVITLISCRFPPTLPDGRAWVNPEAREGGGRRSDWRGDINRAELSDSCEAAYVRVFAASK